MGHTTRYSSISLLTGPQMSREKPLSFFRPISFDETDSFLETERKQLTESSIARPIPTTPRKGISFDESERNFSLLCDDDSSLHSSEERMLGSSGVAQENVPRREGVAKEMNQAIRCRPVSKTQARGRFEKKVSAAGYGNVDKSDSFVKATPTDPENPSHFTPFEKFERGSEDNAGSLKTLSRSDASQAFAPISSFSERGSVPISAASSCSDIFSVRTATITSITTTNSNLSRRDSELMKPMPCRTSGALGSESSQHKKGAELSKKKSRELSRPNRSASYETGGGSSNGSCDKITGRKHSRQSCRISQFGSESRTRSGTDPRNISKQTVRSSSSSNTDAEEKSNSRISFERKSSIGSVRASGPLGVLRLKKPSSRDDDDDGDGDDESNPWFQERSGSKWRQELSGDEKCESGVERTESQDASALKQKKIRFKKIGRHLFGKEKDDRTVVPAETIGAAAVRRLSSFDDTASLPILMGSTNLHSDTISEPRRDKGLLERDIRKALSAKQPLESVLCKFAALRERPSEDTQNQFYKYLSSGSMIERGIQLILQDDVASSDEESCGKSLNSRRTRRIHCELLIHSYINGPSRLKKALLNSSKTRALISAFLTRQAREMKRGSEVYLFKVHSMAKVLSAIMSENTSDVIEFLSGSPGFLYSLVKHHIRVAEVVDFVCQLCAANALSESDGEELRYGAPNAAGIVLLAKERICDLIVRVFEDSCEEPAITQDKSNWQLHVMSTECLIELSKRSVVIPKFSKNNCSYSSRHIRSLNDALQSINSFENVERVSRLLKAGLRCVDSTEKSVEATRKTNAAVCVLSLVTELLDLVSSASDSKSVVTRRTVGTANTKGLESLLVEQIPTLCAILAVRNCKGAHGRLKLEIVKCFRSLFGSKWEESRNALAQSDVPKLLLLAVRENKLWSILHGMVVECVATSLKREESGKLHQTWLRALEEVGMMDEMVEILKCKSDQGGDAEGQWSTYRSTVVDIGFVMYMFSQNLTRGAFRALFASEERYQTFIGRIEPGLGKVEESRRGACGGPKPEGAVVSVLANADALAAKINDFEAV